MTHRCDPGALLAYICFRDFRFGVPAQLNSNSATHCPNSTNSIPERSSAFLPESCSDLPARCCRNCFCEFRFRRAAMGVGGKATRCYDLAAASTTHEKRRIKGNQFASNLRFRAVDGFRQEHGTAILVAGFDNAVRNDV